MGEDQEGACHPRDPQHPTEQAPWPPSPGRGHSLPFLPTPLGARLPAASHRLGVGAGRTWIWGESHTRPSEQSGGWRCPAYSFPKGTFPSAATVRAPTAPPPPRVLPQQPLRSRARPQRPRASPRRPPAPRK